MVRYSVGQTPLGALIQALEEAKAKYHDKVVSASGNMALMLRWVYTLPETSADYWWTLLQSNLFDLILSLTLGVTITVNPQTWEALGAVNTAIQQLAQQISAQEYALQLTQITVPQFQAALMSQQCGGNLTKAYFGVSCYDYSYYDPLFTVEALRDQIKRDISRRTTKSTIDQLLVGMDWRQDVAAWIRYWREQIASLIHTQFLLGWNMLSISPLRMQPAAPLAFYPWLQVDGAPSAGGLGKNVPSTTTDQPLYGLILGLTPLGLGIFQPLYQSPINDLFRLWPAVLAAANLAQYTPVSTASKLAEAAAPTTTSTPSYLHSRRADKWYQGTLRAQHARALARRLCNEAGLPGIACATYVAAAEELAMWCYGSEQRKALKYNKRIYARLYAEGGIEAVKQYWYTKYRTWGALDTILDALWAELSTLCP